MGGMLTTLVRSPVLLLRLLRNSLRKKALLAIILSAGIGNVISYLGPLLYATHFGAIQHVGRKYKTSWALVTGASSGLGKALTIELARQGVNVVLVALDDKWLSGTMAELQQRFGNVEFRAVPVNLGKFPGTGEADYMREIIAATEDIDVGLVFNNAGYVYIDGLHSADLTRQLNNIECLVLSVVRITDHFYKRMVASQRPGAFWFTSSQGGFFPAPLSTVYGGGKAFVASYATTLAIEAAKFGIDVCCVHPGYIKSNFSSNMKGITFTAILEKIGNTPAEIASAYFRAIGRANMIDVGLFSYGSRLVLKFIDLNPLIWLHRKSMHLAPDFRNVMQRPVASSTNGRAKL